MRVTLCVNTLIKSLWNCALSFLWPKNVDTGRCEIVWVQAMDQKVSGLKFSNFQGYLMRYADVSYNICNWLVIVNYQVSWTRIWLYKIENQRNAFLYIFNPSWLHSRRVEKLKSGTFKKANKMTYFQKKNTVPVFENGQTLVIFRSELNYWLID